MNFLNAFLHALAGYGIRRKGWTEHQPELVWDSINQLFTEVEGEKVFSYCDLGNDVLKADWEVI